LQRVCIQSAICGTFDECAEFAVIFNELGDQLPELIEANCSGKNECFFSCKVHANFLFPELGYFSLPGSAINVSRLQRTVHPHAQGKCVLVLTREWNQVLVAKHIIAEPNLRRLWR